MCVCATLINTSNSQHFYMKIAIFCSRLLQNSHQNASIIKCF